VRLAVRHLSGIRGFRTYLEDGPLPTRHLEREAKFRLCHTRQGMRLLRAAVNASHGLRLHEGVTSQVIDVYLDTGAKVLRAHGLALRVRHKHGERDVITLKRLAPAATANDLKRIEVEGPDHPQTIEMVGEELQAARVTQEGERPTTLRESIQAWHLSPVAVLAQRRREFRVVAKSGDIACASMDSVWSVFPHASEPYHILEVELRDTAGAGLVKCLERHGLIKETRSKLEVATQAISAALDEGGCV